MRTQPSKPFSDGCSRPLGTRFGPSTSGEEGIDEVARGDVSVALLDLDLSGMSGADTLRAIRAMSPAPEVVVTSARGTVTAAAEAARHGAFDFVPQPFDFKDLSEILRAAHEQAGRRRQALHLEAALRAHDPFPEIVGRSPGSSACSPWSTRPRGRSPRSSSRARAGRARSWWPGPSMPTARGPPRP